MNVDALQIVLAAAAQAQPSPLARKRPAEDEAVPGVGAGPRVLQVFRLPRPPEVQREDRGADVGVFPCDVGDRGAVELAVDRVIQRFGRIDVLVNNVGMNLLTPSVADTDPALWQKIIDSNLNGTFYCSRRAAAAMAPR